MASRTNIILKVGNRKTHSPSTDIPQDTDEMTTVQIMHEIEEHNYAEKNPSVDGRVTYFAFLTLRKEMLIRCIRQLLHKIRIISPSLNGFGFHVMYVKTRFINIKYL